MVTRNENGFCITVPTGGMGHPAEEYTETLLGLFDLLESQDDDMQRKDYHVLELIKAMLPTYEQAKTMLDMDFDDGKVKQLHERYSLTCCK